MPTNSSFRMQGRGATVAEENRTKSHGNCLPWKPAHLFFLLLLSCSFGRGGCISCQLHNNNGTGTHLAFITAGTVKQHVISKGFQSISCAAVNFCRIRWYRLSADARTMEPYPWDLGNFTIVAPVDANQTLRFQSADDAAEGSYVCVASNGTHQINRSTHLTVDVRYWTGDPLQLQHKLCHNRTAEVGQNVTLFCQFYVGLEVRLTTVYWRRPNTSLPQEQWSGCGQGWDWLGIGVLRKVSHYTTYHMRLIQHMNDSGSETPWIGSRLDIVNVSEEAYGIYCVIANNGGHWSRDVLMLSPPDEKPPPVVRHYQELPWVVVGSAFLMVSVSLLVWKMVALEVKLWYHGRYGDDEQNDGKLYDAYISYSWSDGDRKFVLQVVMPYLEQYGYRLFVPEIHTVPSNVLLEELSKAMEASRRCVLVITPSYTTSEYGKYELELATDIMSSKLSERVIPIFLGVSPFADPSPLYGSEPSLTSLSSDSSFTTPSSLSGSSQPSSLSSDCQTDEAHPSTSGTPQDGISSLTSSHTSANSGASSSKPVKINFNFSPLLGQLIKVLKPLKTDRIEPYRPCNHSRFLKRLRLRLPKPPAQRAEDINLRQDVIMETMSQTSDLVDNEVLPDMREEDVGFRMQTLPRLYPVVPNDNTQNDGIYM